MTTQHSQTLAQLEDEIRENKLTYKDSVRAVTCFKDHLLASGITTPTLPGESHKTALVEPESLITRPPIHVSLVQEFFGGLQDATKFVPGTGHRNFLERMHPDDHYAMGLLSDLGLHVFDGLVEIRAPVPIGNLVGTFICTGSPMSNYLSRLIMHYQYKSGNRDLGLERRRDPIFILPYEYCLDANYIRQHFGGQGQRIHRIGYQVDNWSIRDVASNKDLVPKLKEHQLQSDYLLITILPNILHRPSHESGCQIFILGGTHGVGTRAISILFNNEGLLRRLIAIKNSLSEIKAWQVLLEIDQVDNNQERPHPLSFSKDLKYAIVDIESRMLKRWLDNLPRHTRSVSAFLNSSRSSFPAAWQPAQIVEAMRPAGWTRLFVLGCFDQLKTVYTQQVRALTTIHALFAAGILRPDVRMAVVGGGAAGVTAAAAAASKGCKVTIYESANTLLHLQALNHDRYLHPHLYHWPQNGPPLADAGLPLLDWTANAAANVAHQINEQLQGLRSRPGVTLIVRTSTQIIDIQKRDDNTIRVVGNEGAIDEDFDAAIIAIGFGVEPNVRFGVETPAYWAKDALDQDLRIPRGSYRILVSGAGDGALIDILRAAIYQFRHEDIVNLMPSDSPTLLQIRDQFAAIEAKARQLRQTNPAEKVPFNRWYGDLDIPEALIDCLHARAWKNREVVFNYPDPEMFEPDSALLNRFIVYLLLKGGIIKPRLGRLTDIHKITAPTGDTRYRAIFNDRPPPNGADDFDCVVVRHGPPIRFFETVFPDLASACAPLAGKIAALGLANNLHGETFSYFFDSA